MIDNDVKENKRLLTTLEVRVNLPIEYLRDTINLDLSNGRYMHFENGLYYDWSKEIEPHLTLSYAIKKADNNDNYNYFITKFKEHGFMKRLREISNDIVFDKTVIFDNEKNYKVIGLLLDKESNLKLNNIVIDIHTYYKLKREFSNIHLTLAYVKKSFDTSKIKVKEPIKAELGIIRLSDSDYSKIRIGNLKM